MMPGEKSSERALQPGDWWANREEPNGQLARTAMAQVCGFSLPKLKSISEIATLRQLTKKLLSVKFQVDEVTMPFGIFKTLLAEILFLSICSVLGTTASFAQCSVLNVMVKGEVQSPPRGGVVRVQLVYRKHSKDQNGESGEETLENESFRIQIPFLTQSGAPVLGLGSFKCDLRPKTVVVTLVAGDHEYERVSLDWAKDFKMTDLTEYALRSDLVLHGTP